MAQRRHHYELAFEEFLRTQRIPYVAVDEARKTLVPIESARGTNGTGESSANGSLKSFDFVIYTQPHNLLLDIKGRKVASRKPKPAQTLTSAQPSSYSLYPELPRITTPSPSNSSAASLARGRLENWVTQEDVDSLTHWERLFGPDFRAAFVFVYWCESEPPDSLFQEIYEHKGLWYALRAVYLSDYTKHMKTRSARWETVDLPTRAFESISHPLSDWTRTVSTPPSTGPSHREQPFAATPRGNPAYTHLPD